MPRPRDDDDREARRLVEVIYGTRERVTFLENELDRVRERQHAQATDLAVVRFLAEKVEEQGEAIKANSDAVASLATEVRNLPARSLPRPRQSTLALALQAVVALTAILALVVALTR
jgi:hypothetical protein